MSERKKVLWLVSWYPNKYDPFDGDFIQRHARAAALNDDIVVLFVKQAEEQSALERAEHQQGTLTERLLYLPKINGLPGKLLNYYQWWRICKKEVKELIGNQPPHLVHVHVPWKAGLVALWLKRKHRIPFVVTEHWDIYNHVVDDNIYKRSLLFRYLLKRIYRESQKLVSVSSFIADEVSRLFGKTEAAILPNVVDTEVFSPGKEKYDRFTFLHVSNLAPKKNATGVLSAFHQFHQQTSSQAQLIIVGNRDDEYVQLAQQMGLLNQSVFFRGEIPYSEVAGEMQKAHVLVLNSNMENSPCVIGEALCCGLPVIATAVGGIPELVSPENSLLIPPLDTHALANALTHMAENYSRFNPERIAAAARQKFSMPVIGQQLHRLYGE